MCKELIEVMGITLVCGESGRHHWHQTTYYDEGINAKIKWKKVDE